MRILNVEPDRYDEPLRSRLAELGEVEYRRCRDQDEFEATLAESRPDVVMVRLGLGVTAEVLRRAGTVRVVATPTTGLDHLDLEACSAAGVEVLSLRGEEAFLRTVRSTAEHTWALLLALCRQIPRAHAEVIAGRWRREPFVGVELDGRTLGLIGLGRLGRMVAGYGLAFGMRVLAADVRPEAFAEAPAGVEPAGVEDLLAVADVVSLHLPLNPATAKLLGRGRLSAMKPGALLVNTARGELIDEAALAEALASGRLGGAALDVLAGDGRWPASIPPDHPLAGIARAGGRLLLTPHVGGYGDRSLARTREFLIGRLATLMRSLESDG